MSNGIKTVLIIFGFVGATNVGRVHVSPFFAFRDIVYVSLSDCPAGFLRQRWRYCTGKNMDLRAGDHKWAPLGSFASGVVKGHHPTNTTILLQRFESRKNFLVHPRVFNLAALGNWLTCFC